jgi:hypothetical protein
MASLPARLGAASRNDRHASARRTDGVFAVNSAKFFADNLEQRPGRAVATLAIHPRMTCVARTVVSYFETNSGKDVP